MNTRQHPSDVNHLDLTHTNAVLHMYELKTGGGCTPLTVLETLTTERNGTLKRTKVRTLPGSMTKIQKALVACLPETNSIRAQISDNVSVK